MVNGGHLHAAPLEPLSVLLRDLKVLLDDDLCRNAPEAHDDLRLHQRRLPPQIADAGVLLHVQRVPVLRRAALDHVGNVDLCPVQMDDLQHIVQKLSRPAYKGHALLILVLAGSLADEHDLRRFASIAEDYVRPGVRQRAAPAGGTFRPQRFPSIRHCSAPSRFFECITNQRPMQGA